MALRQIAARALERLRGSPTGRHPRKTDTIGGIRTIQHKISYSATWRKQTFDATLKIIPVGLLAACIRNIDERPAITSEDDAFSSALRTDDFEAEAVLDQVPSSGVLARAAAVHPCRDTVAAEGKPERRKKH